MGTDMKTAEKKVTTFQDVVDAEVGHIFVDRFDEGVRFVILRGPVALCAYLGIPADHPLANHDYDSIPLDCHGGLTYANLSESKDKSYLPVGLYWYGWDYGHYGDRTTYDNHRPSRLDEKAWTPEMVESDSWSAIYRMKKLMRIAEQARNSGK